MRAALVHERICPPPGGVQRCGRNLGNIAADSLEAADGVREEIYDAIQSLVPFPYIGHSRPDLTSRPLRFQSVRDYVIAYAPDEKPLAVIAVLHGLLQSASNRGDTSWKNLAAFLLSRCARASE